MKFKSISILAFAALAVIACEKNPEDKAPLTQDEQKEKLNSVAIELLDYADAANWSDAVTSMTNFIAIFEDDEYDKSALDNLKSKEEDDDEEEFPGYGYFCNYIKAGEFETIDSKTIALSDYKGKYTLDQEKKAWVYTPSNALSFAAEYNGESYTVNATFKDTEDKLRISSDTDEYGRTWEEFQTGPAQYMVKKHNEDYNYDYYEPESRTNNDITEYHFYNPFDNTDLGWISATEIYNDRAAFESRYTVPAGTHVDREIEETYLAIPSSIEAEFSTAAGKVASISAKFSHKSAEKGIFDITKDQISAEVSLTAADYTLSINKFDYLSSAGEIDCVFSYKGNDILRLNITEAGASLTEKVAERHSENDLGNGVKTFTNRRRIKYDADASNIPTTATIDADILGQIQIKGQADIESIMTAIQESKSIKDEAAAKAWAKKVEQYFDLDVYFDNSKNVSASLGIEVVKNDEAYKAIPVIRYPDETEYTAASDFFTLGNFAESIAAALKWYDNAKKFIPDFSE